MPFGTEKLEWLGYVTVKKVLKIRLFVLTQSTNVTDGWTLRDGKSHACIASRGKNLSAYLLIKDKCNII